MLQAIGLTRRYGGLLALDRVSFEVRRGEVLGYLGPNGSGKSTTVNIIAGLLEPSGGRVTLHGTSVSDDPAGYKSRIGYVPEEPYLYTHLTAAEYLGLVGSLRGLPATTLGGRVDDLLQLLGLHDARYAPLSAYSKGMRQRVLLASALLHDPELLVLDEPFSGLDVAAGFLFRALIAQFVASGRMILFSSHRFDVVHRVCSRVVILSRGRIVAERALGGQDGGAAALEELFVQVTEQEDFAGTARAILGAVQRS